MKKLSALLMVLFMVIFALSGCTGSSNNASTPSPQPSSEKMVLKLGHAANLEQPYHIAAVQFAKDVLEATDGKIEIQVFPNNQLGGQRELLEGLQLGTCDIAFTSSAVLGNFLPRAQVIDLPFLFKDAQHVYKVVDGPLAAKIYEGAEGQGFKVISTWENGFRNVMTTKKPVVTPEDMKGLKIRVFESKLYVDMFELLGALPTPMAWAEVFTGLQQGTIDALENSVVQLYASKFQEVAKHLTLTGHTYNPQCVVFSLNVWNKIPAEYQQKIIELANKNRDYNRKLAAEKSVEYLEEMKKAGVEVVELTAEQNEAFRKKMLPVWESYYKIVGKDLVDEIVATK